MTAAPGPLTAIHPAPRPRPGEVVLVEGERPDGLPVWRRGRLVAADSRHLVIDLPEGTLAELRAVPGSTMTVAWQGGSGRSRHEVEVVEGHRFDVVMLRTAPEPAERRRQPRLWLPGRLLGDGLDVAVGDLSPSGLTAALDGLPAGDLQFVVGTVRIPVVLRPDPGLRPGLWRFAEPISTEQLARLLQVVLRDRPTASGRGLSPAR